MAALVNASPATLDTLKELADAIGDDPNFAATIATQLGLKAPLASPALTGTPTAPTAAPGTSTTQIASTAFVAAAITALVNAAPGALDTLKELADAIGDDPNFAATLASQMALKAPLASPALTGSPTAPTATAGTSTTQIATTAFVAAAVAALVNAAPGTLDTLKELADAIGDDPNYAATVATALGFRLRVDAAQALSAAQRAQGRANAGLSDGSASDVALAALNGGQLAGLRNRIINGSFGMNVRGYASGTALAAGAYGHDRWKAGSGGATYTFTQAAIDTQITITAGTLVQVVEAGFVEGGAFVLSWAGTATARVGISGAAPSGAYAASPILVTGATAGQGITVEFATGTLVRVQLEPGGAPTPHERRSVMVEGLLCRRYARKLGRGLRYWAVQSGAIEIPFEFAEPMRVAPTITALTASIASYRGSSGNFSMPIGNTIDASGSAQGGHFLFAPGSGAPAINAGEQFTSLQDDVLLLTAEL